MMPVDLPSGDDDRQHTRPVVEHRPVCLKSQGSYQARLLTADHY